MTQVQVFNHQKFGQVRMIEYKGKFLFVGIDVAKALEYTKPSQAVINHCKGILKLGIPSKGGTQETNVIPEGDVYRLIVKAADQSRNPEIRAKAEEYERWLFDEVLPTIRKEGSYFTSQSKNEDTKIEIQKKRIEVMLKNAQIKQAKLLLDTAYNFRDRLPDVSLESLIAAGTKTLTGQDLIPQRNVGQKFYTCEEIAKKIGMLSKSGNPHNQAVAALIKHIGFSEDEVVTVLESTGASWQGTTDKYSESVVARVVQKVRELGYPPVLNLGKSFNVFWAHQSA